jgi:hypothetical protein
LLCGFLGANHLVSRRLWVAIPIIAITSCGRQPESFPMPPQKRAPETSDPNYLLVKFSDRDAGDYIVRDIQSGDGLCWTFAHPEMKFPVEPRPALRFYMHFWIHERTLHDTGPVTLTVKINGQLLGSVRCEHDGSYLFERPVPMQWLHSGEPVHVLAEATPLWTSPDGGPPLGYLIEEAGFRW